MTKELKLGDNVSIRYENDKPSDIIINDVLYQIRTEDEALDIFVRNKIVRFIYLTLRKSDNHFYIGKCKVSGNRKKRIFDYFGSGAKISKRINEIKKAAKLAGTDEVSAVKEEFERFILCFVEGEDEELAEMEEFIVDESLYIRNSLCLNVVKGGIISVDSEHRTIKDAIRSCVSKRKYYEDNTAFDRLFNGSKKYWSNPENVEKQRKNCIEVWQREGYREMMSENRKKRLSSSEARKKQSENAKKGWRNKSKEQWERDEARIVSLWENEERHIQQSQIISDKFKDEEWKEEWNKKFYASIQTEEWKRKNEEHMRILRENTIKRTIERRNNIIIEMYDLDWNLLMKFNMNEALEYIHKNLSKSPINSINIELLRYFKGGRISLYGHKWKKIDNNPMK